MLSIINMVGILNDPSSIIQVQKYATKDKITGGIHLENLDLGFLQRLFVALNAIAACDSVTKMSSDRYTHITAYPPPKVS